MRALSIALVILLLNVDTALGHEGPPFPIVVDHEMGSMLVSVWTDPDIGIGTFFVVIEPASEDYVLPDDLRVRIAVTPQSGRLPEAMYDADPQSVRYGARYMAEVEFDRGEWWDVRVLIDSSDHTGEITTEVEATPDETLGPISLLLFLLPFLAVGFLWLKAVLRKRQPSSRQT